MGVFPVDRYLYVYSNPHDHYSTSASSTGAACFPCRRGQRFYLRQERLEENPFPVGGVPLFFRIRKLKKPEPYKGKGIHYVGETIRRKVGKAGK